MGNRIVVSTIFCLSIAGNLTVVSILFSNGKSNRCFNNFWPCIISNLSVVSILLSNGKSNCCFKNFLDLRCRQSIRRFNSFLKWEIEPLFQQCFGLRLQGIYPLFQFFYKMKNVTVVSTIFWPSIIGNLSVVSIILSNGKSNRCFKTFSALHCR